MQGTEGRRPNPELRAMIAEASRALALLDADRLEELARACQALNRRPIAMLEREVREAAGAMAVFGRVLDATRANLMVMKRLSGLRQGRLGYTDTLGER